ncbi:hypothetical protein M885DRAFT_570716 [Pelagophyceae sp. CCMP2097]|nr:hypothetical protein M885DRAFT_570716 [Pelagophyceae sp. CCMP2097]
MSSTVPTAPSFLETREDPTVHAGDDDGLRRDRRLIFDLSRSCSAQLCEAPNMFFRLKVCYLYVAEAIFVGMAVFVSILVWA